MNRLLASVLVSVAAIASSAEVIVKDGESIAFFGDGITERGYNEAGGYVNLVTNSLASLGVRVTVIPMAVRECMTREMKSRVRDLVARRPSWVAISCGMNDVWYGKNGVSLEEFKTNVTEMLDFASGAGVKALLLTPTMIRENPKNRMNQTLAGYVDFMVEIGRRRNVPVADLNAEMQSEVKRLAGLPTKYKVTYDGLYMNRAGNRMMARGVLKALGVKAEELPELEKRWDDIAGVEYATIPLSVNEKRALEAEAEAAHTSVGTILRRRLLAK